jgi:hypothetical protein
MSSRVREVGAALAASERESWTRVPAAEGAYDLAMLLPSSYFDALVARDGAREAPSS